jgi:hypothetical protein
LITIGAPHTGQAWSDGRVAGITVRLPSALRTNSLVLRHSGIAGAGQEVAVPAPLDDHRLAALLANLVGRLLSALRLRISTLALLEIDLERLVEVAQQLDPVRLALLHLIQLLFHLAVKSVLTMSGKLFTSKPLTITPSSVG